MTNETKRTAEPEILAYQDGREFYDDSTGEVLFTSSILVPDGDMRAARKARAEFIDWSIRKNLRIAFI